MRVFLRERKAPEVPLDPPEDDKKPGDATRRPALTTPAQLPASAQRYSALPLHPTDSREGALEGGRPRSPQPACLGPVDSQDLTAPLLPASAAVDPSEPAKARPSGLKAQEEWPLAITKAGARASTSLALVELPADFSAEGDSGAIGRVTMSSLASAAHDQEEAKEGLRPEGATGLDLQGTLYNLHCFHPATTLLLTRITSKGKAQGTAEVQVCFDTFYRAEPLRLPGEAEALGLGDGLDTDVDLTPPAAAIAGKGQARKKKVIVTAKGKARAKGGAKGATGGKKGTGAKGVKAKKQSTKKQSKKPVDMQ